MCNTLRSLCDNQVVDRDHALAVLRSHEAELRAAGVKHLRLFGSVARGDQTPESDVDIALELQPGTRLGFALGGLQMDLSEWLAVHVDVLLLRSLRPALRERISLEGIDAF